MINRVSHDQFSGHLEVKSRKLMTVKQFKIWPQTSYLFKVRITTVLEAWKIIPWSFDSLMNPPGRTHKNNLYQLRSDQKNIDLRHNVQFKPCLVQHQYRHVCKRHSPHASLQHVTVAARLLGLRVRIPPGGGMDVYLL